MSIFGAICSGRPMVLAEQVDQTKFVINVPNASNISYITIFILPNSPFVDDNFTALVYFQLPPDSGATGSASTGGTPEFKLLGGINPRKPSAIYKISNIHPTSKRPDDGMDLEMGSGEPIDLTDSVSINIGISIEPTPQAEQIILQSKQSSNSNSNALVPTSRAQHPTTNTPDSTAKLANKIVGHAYNYLASFIDPQGKVPIKAFDTWWDKFKAKLQNNPNFLDELSE
ncbi:hypothetical protein KGF57_000280 [Candida theae]|uniref:Hikeshi-like domain-containing protein n=1 Tax=Candida theae TaxID=1198502 RepID=A0AAD5BJE3_9ASCO|nr:uncharacterized protein KGF57_000280 [Candida theae]KAI5967813.1 hypothetical protein KGF57_000280 [Candida theae]